MSAVEGGIPTAIDPAGSPWAGAGLPAATPESRVTMLPIAGRNLRSQSHSSTLSGVNDQRLSTGALEHFVVGPENQLTAALFTRWLQEATPGKSLGSYSPVVLVGASGMGKTHLARGLARGWSSRTDGGLASYFTASDFARQLATAIDERNLASFRHDLHDCNLLVIDDLDRLSPRADVQHELVEALDAHREQKRLVLVASSRPLAQVEQLSRSLLNRLSSGLVVELAPPGPDARREILRQVCQASGLRATAEALDHLAAHLPAEPPALIGLMLRAEQLLKTLNHAAATHIDLTVANELLQRSSAALSPPATSILAAVAKHFGISRRTLVGPTRRQSVVLARSVAMYLVRILTPLSYVEVGKLFGGRDHTTVIHNFNRVQQALTTDAVLRDAVEALKRRVQMS